MSKNFKKNKGLIITLAGAGVVSLLLLVWVFLILIEWSELRDRTQMAREKVQKLVKSTPAPGAENERRIQADIELYEKKNIGLVDNFKFPLQPAVDAFLAALPPANHAMLSEEEIERYKVEGTGVEESEDTPAVPLKIRKFNSAEFREFILGRFEIFCNDNNITEDADKYSLSTIHRFGDNCMKFFPPGKWNSALDKFEVTAEPLTFEVIDYANRLPILLAAFGFPRSVDSDATENGRKKLAAQIDNMIERKILPVANFEGSPNPGFFAPGSLNFLGGGTEYDGSGKERGSSSSSSGQASQWTAADYPSLFFHWDVFGDIAQRLFDNGVLSLQQIVLRTKAAESGDESGRSSSGINLPESFESDGNYKLYHYTVVFVCKMDVLHKVLVNLDTAWRGDGKHGRRMYVVRGFALYATVDGAQHVMYPVGDGKKDEQSSRESAAPRRPRSRRRQREESVEQQSSAQSEVMFKPLYEVSEEEAKRRYYDVHRRLNGKIEKRETIRIENGQIVKVESNKELSDEDKKKAYSRYEKSLPIHQRFDYARVLVGEHNDECEVYLDIDYVVLEQNQ